MDFQAIGKEFTSKNILIAAALGIIMGLVLQAVIVVFGRGDTCQFCSFSQR
jgi:hypothetical protein